MCTSVLFLSLAFECLENNSAARPLRTASCLHDYVDLHKGDTQLNMLGDTICVLSGALCCQAIRIAAGCRVSLCVSFAWCCTEDCFLWLHMHDGSIAMWMRLACFPVELPSRGKVNM